jgi:hypothetical protein
VAGCCEYGDEPTGSPSTELVYRTRKFIADFTKGRVFEVTWVYTYSANGSILALNTEIRIHLAQKRALMRCSELQGSRKLEKVFSN